MTPPDFESALREQLVATVADRTPGEAPYEAIRRQGRAARRRRTAAISAGVVVLTVLSGATVLTARGHSDARPATGLTATTDGAAVPSPASTPSATPSAAPTPAPTGPQPPSTAAQLADGITFEQASTALGQCLDFDRQMQARRQSPPPSTVQGAQGTQGTQGAHPNRPPVHDLGALTDYRVLLAVKSTGDDNSPGDGISVVGVSQGEHPSQVICHQVDGKASGIQSGTADPRAGGPAGLVNPDINAGKLYRQAMIDDHAWKLPYRWGSIGTFAPSVARVTVSYGDGPAVDAALDHGWFAATGVLTNPVTRAPHVKGYDGSGKLVYDSDDDKGYQKEL
ncbi:hypothetical protein PUR71_07735 [Streptomyces sp. SP17BM10]|uniref:hypothetical protein n=1 Tax=Streptomyces sp. SP17BM10 TaxID=3002530 RepID=UPI002E759F4C|nr:hypothetical protein [Streptomyces sp. SP17BM10]MEE1782805.1 hypothetical protein [Streptomyces sp. SP17BM10]